MPSHRNTVGDSTTVPPDEVSEADFMRQLSGDTEREEKARRDDNAGTSIAVQSRFLDDDLRAITSFEDAVKLLGDTEVTDAADYGNGFVILKEEEKRRLVGVPFLILSFNVQPEGKFGAPFASLMIVTKPGEKLIVNDGGTGIAVQVMKIKDKCDKVGAPYRGVVCKHGLRASDYVVSIPHPMTGIPVPTPATTYYLDTSA